MKILVMGDWISDVYTFGRVSRVCPEAPVPVLIPEREVHSDGGAGLVAAQLKELGADVEVLYGSESVKYRYFAGSHLLMRMDNDSYSVNPPKAIPEADVYVVADYGKGGMTWALAQQLIDTKKPLYVDAKHHWQWYISGRTTMFPNEHEECSWTLPTIVRKLGARGCKMGSIEIPATTADVVDVTGAGDCFMAGFVYAAAHTELTATGCLKFANAIAGQACCRVGTYVVPRAFATAYLGRLATDAELWRPFRASSPHSTQVVPPRWPQQDHYADEQNIGIGGNPHANYSQASAESRALLESHYFVQTGPQSPLVPTESSDAQTPEDQGIAGTGDTKSQTEHSSPSPSESERQCERKSALDLNWIGGQFRR